MIREDQNSDRYRRKLRVPAAGCASAVRTPGVLTTLKVGPAKWVSASNSRIWTSDPSSHLTRHLLSYLDHQETTVLRPDFLVPGARNVPFGRRRGCRKPSKSPPQVSVGLYRVGFDIRSIEARLVTSFEPSTLPGDGGITSRLHLLPVRESVPRERETVEIGPARGCQVMPCRF